MGAAHALRRAILAGFGVVLTTLTAHAQNADPFFYGDEAALASGAVVASGRDSGSLWYDPAGFGGPNRGLVSANASTFGIRIRTVPNAMTIVGVPGGAALSSVDAISVPNAIVAATRLGSRFTLAAVGGGLFADRDTVSAAEDVDHVDYYGVTLGFSKRTRLALVEDPSPEALVLVTTLSLRSSVGIGQGIGIANQGVPETTRVDVTYYEIMPYFGSAVVF